MPSPLSKTGGALVVGLSRRAQEARLALSIKGGELELSVLRGRNRTNTIFDEGASPVVQLGNDQLSQPFIPGHGDFPGLSYCSV